METKICSVCQVKFSKPTIYCSRKCYSLVPKSEETKRKMSVASLGKPKSLHMREALSKATSGKPKPWAQGTNNINYGGAYSNDPIIHAKFLDAVKERGQAWTDEHRKAHSQLMLGDTNAMRGLHHSPETIKLLSDIQIERHKSGIAIISRNKISKPEKEIMVWLDIQEIKYKSQYHIMGAPYTYDLYIPHINLIIEYNGDYWHANPNKYADGSLLKIVGKGLVLVNDIWARDKLKKEAALNNGYKFAVIWETEYKKLGMESVLSCLK